MHSAPQPSGQIDPQTLAPHWAWLVALVQAAIRLAPFPGALAADTPALFARVAAMAAAADTIARRLLILIATALDAADIPVRPVTAPSKKQARVRLACLKCACPPCHHGYTRRMRKVEPLPASIQRYHHDFHGEVEYVFFEDADTQIDTALAAIDIALEGASIDRLKALGHRAVTLPAFMGNWYDPATGNLIRCGTWTSKSGETFKDPVLKTMDDFKLKSGGGGIFGPGKGGNYAYAFFNPPYGVRGKPSSIQAIFEEVNAIILPENKDVIIRDWCHPELPEVSSYFDAGNEWWGMFLFTLHIQEDSKLCVIMASATD